MKLIGSALKLSPTRATRAAGFMRVLSALLLVLTLAASLPNAAQAAEQPTTNAGQAAFTPGTFKPGEVVVKFRAPEGGLRVTNAGSLHPESLVNDPLVQRYGVNGFDALARMPGYFRYYASSAADMSRLVAAMGANPNVEYAEPNYIWKAAKTPNDKLYNQTSDTSDPNQYRQWYLKKIGIEALWDVTTGNNQVIAVLDTGIDPNHEDLCNSSSCSKYYPAQKFNTLTNTYDAFDDDGHGTAVTGVIAAGTNNGRGMAGINWNAQILPVKVLNAVGAGTDISVAQGIIYASDNQARIINMSLGAQQLSKIIEDVIKYAQNKGVMIVAAAGNDPDGRPTIPAFYPNVISVAATDKNDKAATFTNPSSTVSVAAPGVDIFTILTANPNATGLGCNNNNVLDCYKSGNNWYGYISGTSFAAPIVTGLVSLIVAARPDLTNEQIKRLIETTADDIDVNGRDARTGFGRVNAANIAAALTSENFWPNNYSVLQGMVTGANPADVIVNLDPPNVNKNLDVSGGFRYDNLGPHIYGLRVSVPKRSIVLGPVLIYPTGQSDNVISVNFDVSSGAIVCGPGAQCPGSAGPAPGAPPSPPPPSTNGLAANAIYFVPATPKAGQRFFPETGHNLGGAFRSYWESKGGLAIFGFPTSEEFTEVSATDGNTYTVQYFERNRFEFHPENNEANKVLLGLLGRELTTGRNFPPGAPIATTATTTYFQETQHSLSDRFLAYWKANGGLAIFGFPISEPIQEGNYLVQYFERNRFEYHPENAGTKYEVLLGLLGNDLARNRNYIR